MKLSKYAKNLGLSYMTAFNHFHKGLISGAYQLPSGTIIVPDNDYTTNPEEIYPNQVALYARVSSHKQKEDLDRQIKRLQDYASAKGYVVYKTVSEIASGLNDKRDKLSNLLLDNKYNILIIEHKDRLTRFGFNYIDMMFQKENRIIEIINLEEDKSDLMTDFVSLITSFCARIYGQRRSQRKSTTILKAMELEDIEAEDIIC